MLVGQIEYEEPLSRNVEHMNRLCRKFSFDAICGMISLFTQVTKEERGMAVSFKGAHFPRTSF